METIILGAINALIYYKSLIIYTVLIIAICILIKTIYQYKKYGFYSVFGVFRKRKNPKPKEMILLLLSKLKRYKRVFYFDDTKTIMVMVDVTGIYIFVYFALVGTISGDYNCDYLDISNGLNKNIDNFLPILDKCANKILDVIPNSNVIKCVITSDNSYFKITNTDINFIKIENLHYFLKRKQSIYTKKEVVKYASIISKNR